MNRAIYVQSQGNVIRDMGYDLFTDTFSGNNLSILSNHLFTGYSIKEMAYQQTPDSLVWAVRNDGLLLCMTYLREQEVLAWTWCDTNDGADLYESVACVPSSGYDQVWTVVNRGGQRYIEYFDQRLASTNREDQFFVDCGITFDAGATIDIYTKLLMHCDTTAFNDEKGSSVSNYGVTLNTTEQKFGLGCAQFDGASYLEITDSSTLTYGTGNWTFEFIANFDRLGIIEFFGGQMKSTASYAIFFKDDNDKLGISFLNGGTVLGDYITTNAYPFNTGKNYQLLFERSGANAFIFIDGVSQTLNTLTSFSTNDLGTVSASFIIGSL